MWEPSCMYLAATCVRQECNMRCEHSPIGARSRPLNSALLTPSLSPTAWLGQALQTVEARSEEASAAADAVRGTLRETEERLERSEERLRQSEGLRSKEAKDARESLQAARKALEEAEADAAERSRERSARAAGLQDVLRKQGALLAERCFFFSIV